MLRPKFLCAGTRTRLFRREAHGCTLRRRCGWPVDVSSAGLPSIRIHAPPFYTLPPTFLSTSSATAIPMYGLPITLQSVLRLASVQPSFPLPLPALRPQQRQLHVHQKGIPKTWLRLQIPIPRMRPMFRDFTARHLQPHAEFLKMAKLAIVHYIVEAAMILVSLLNLVKTSRRTHCQTFVISSQ